MLLIEKIIQIAMIVIIISSVVIPVTDAFVEDNSIDVLLIDGQSNGAYFTNHPDWVSTTVVNQELGEPEHKAYYYGTATESCSQIVAGAKIREMYRDGSWKIAGNEAGLAYYLMEKNNRDVLVLNICHGATGIQALATGTEWTTGKALIQAAFKEIDTMYSSKNIVGWVLIHGEADRNQTVEYYEQYFGILEHKLSDLGFKKCYIALPRYSRTVNAYVAMMDIALKDPNVSIATDITKTFTEANGLLYSDDLHYTQKGRLVLDKAVIDYIPANPSVEGASLIHSIPVILIAGVIMLAVRLFHNKTD